MEAQTNRIRSVMSEDCVVLLEELVQSNLDLAAENKKLRYMDRYMEISSFYTEFSTSEQHDALTCKIGFRGLCFLNKFWRPNFA